MWRVKALTDQPNSSNILVETEGYEQANGRINEFGGAGFLGYFSGRDAMTQMWSDYLDNIGSWWILNHGATVQSKTVEPIQQNMNGNPLKAELPEYAQKSFYVPSGPYIPGPFRF